MKTKIKRHSRSALSVLLTLCMLISCMTVGIIATDAAKVASESVGALSVAGHIYFIKPSGWSQVSLMVGHSGYSCGYNMTNISGTSLYYINQSAWSDSTEFAFFDVKNWGGENHNIAYRADYSPNESSTNSSYAMNAGSTYLIATTANSPTYYSSGYSALNNTLTVKTMLKSGSSYAETTTACGTYSATNAKKMNGNGSATSSSFTNSNGTGTLSVARTNTATISQSAASEYTFKGWKATKDTTGSGLSSGNYSFTNSGSATTIYAYYELKETQYSVTVSAGSNGSVASSSVSAGATSAVTLPTATPNYGYKFNGWTSSGGGITISNASSATAATITATGTGGTVTANFTKDDGMNLYIAGRFHIYNGSSWVNSFDSSDWSNTGDDNIKFTWDSTAQKYKVETGASPAELTSQISNINPYFFVYDKTNSKSWYATSSTTLTDSTTSVTLSKSSGANNNLRFNSTSTDKPVTLWFDPTTGVLSYSIPTFYDVTVGTATGGSVTASPTRAEEGTTVTLTISANTGYQLSSITAKRTGTSTAVTLSGSGNTRTFTMPASSVTVTPSFSKITWSGLSAVGKYSTTGASGSYTNTWSSGGPNVTIAATSATQLDGVAVTAPATDPTGYVFAGWITNNGSFTNAANKDTTFKPNAANAQAVATYKKIYTITASVADNGTGAGAEPTISITSGAVAGQTNKLVAGGSYSVTASPVTGSGVESITVNNTNKGSNTSYTITGVSADQTVVVKYKSKVYLKGTMNSTAWAGDVMTANAAGTSYTISNVVLNAGTAYQFRHWVNSGGDGTWSSTVATNGWVLNNLATHGTSGDNLTITPSVKIKVTFISDGSQFTSITAIPYDATQYNVTLKKVDGSTITGEYMGTSFSTASADAVVPVYSGTEISFTVTAASGKYLSGLTTSAGSLSPAFAVGDSYTGKITNVTSARTVTPVVANKFTIAAKTNKSSRGTVSVSPTSARPGQTVTITVSPKSGILKTLTYSYAGGNTYRRDFTNNTWVIDSASSGSSLALFALLDSKMLEPVGAEVESGSVRADATYTFTLDSNPTGNITVNATYDPYSAESNWYYNGYDTSGNKVTAYWGKQMTESMVSGEKFSYYYVGGRTGSDQLFTVSNGRVADTRYVYFTRPSAFGYWNQSNTPKAHFWKNGGSAYDTWPGTAMTWVYDNDMGQAVFKIAIPVGADRVSFNDASNSSTQQTVDINLTNTSGAYYVDSWNDSAQKYNYGTWNTGYSDQGYVVSGTEYFYDSTRYTADYSTKGFYNHNTAGKDYSKPKDLGTSSDGYYVNVLYAGKTYTINGVTKTVGSKDLVIWTKEPLNDDGDTVTVYAKDGAIRSESFGSTYANIADTQIVASANSTTSIGTSQNGNISGQTYETYKAAKGDTIYIRTTINTTAGNGADTTTNRNKYYVRGFCINGEVYQLLEWNSDGVYTTSYKIPEDYESKYVEITPIYYLKDTQAHPIVTYRVTGFTDALKEVGAGKPGWGDTLYTYPFYGKLSSNNNALGAYPGQPMVYYKGQYQMQIPEQSTAWDVYLSDGALSGTDSAKKTTIANTNVSGVTMSNGYYDSVHRLIMGYGSNGASADHVQTYDYGDFFKIFNEKAPVDNIVFDFKYETKKHNFENQPASSITKSTLDTNYGTNGNGFELLTNFHGRHVDLFGTPLSGDAADPEKTTPVYVISIGGVNGSAGVENIAGYYATEWMIYGSSNGTNYTRITGGNKQSIPPEVLILNDDDDTSFSTTTYPSADAKHIITDWKAMYTALEVYRGKPVLISYEAADAQIGAGNYATSGGGGATRNDGRWLYSKNGETITSTIRVDVSEDNGATYTPNDELSTPIEDLDAYFINPEADGETTFTTTIDPDETFDFEAHSNNADYKFMGWYMADGTKITTDNISHTERSGSYTFVARFMHFTGGQLILGHKATTDTTYKGAGTATIAITVKDGNDEIIREIAATSSDITLDDSIINNENTAYTIEVTLNAVGTGEDTYARTTCSAASTYFGGQSAYTSMPQTFSFTVGDLFSGSTQNVKKITYNSYFSKVAYSYKYTFSFPARDGSIKSYVREATLTAAQREAYVEASGSTRTLSDTFVNKIAPHESNFNQTLIWNISASDRTFTKSGNNYTLTKTLTAKVANNSDTLPEGVALRSTKRTATFVLPYAHTNGVPSNTAIMDKTTETNFVINGLDYFELVVNSNSEYVTAPRQLREDVDGNTVVKNFQYWSVASTSNSSVEVARCYFYSFNLVAFDNYIITPVYDTGATQFGDSTDTPITTISYLNTSRNQFNGTGASTTDRSTAADILYNDFVLSFNYNTVDIFKDDTSSDNITDLGYVVERVQKLDTMQDGKPFTDPTHYNGVSVKTDSEIKSFIAENSAGNKTVSSGTLTRHKIAKSELDNKNRIEYYDGFYNSGGWNKDNQAPTNKYGYKNYVYKAYTYMIVDGEVVLSAPVYFTMYDEATK